VFSCRTVVLFGEKLPLSDDYLYSSLPIVRNLSFGRQSTNSVSWFEKLKKAVTLPMSQSSSLLYPTSVPHRVSGVVRCARPRHARGRVHRCLPIARDRHLTGEQPQKGGACPNSWDQPLRKPRATLGSCRGAGRADLPCGCPVVLCEHE
jgi:hypothetical protein